MTTAPEEVLFETTGTPLDTMHERPDGESLSLIARAYMLLVLLGAAAVTLPFLGRLPGTTDWFAFAVFAAAAAIAQLFMVRTPSNQSYHTTIVFLVPAALILPPQQLPLLVLLVHIPEWLKYRYRWPLQTFNIADYIVAVMAAWGAAQLILDSSWIANSSLRFAVAGLTASAVLVLVNHALLAVMLYLAYGHSARATGLFSFENLSTELVLAALGVAFAYFWLENPWLIPFAIAPDPARAPLAHGAGAAGRGARRSEDRPLQRAPLRAGPPRGARPRGALPAAALADHGRPRPAP